MRRTPLSVLLHVRELAERRHLAEAAAARRAAREASARVTAARVTRAGHGDPVPCGDVAAVLAHRCTVIALDELVDASVAHEWDAMCAVAQADARATAAAVAHESAARLHDRRARDDERRAARRVQRRSDEAALEAWRGRR